MEDDLQWKTNFNGRRLSMEDKLQWEMTFGGRRPSAEDDIQWKTTFGSEWLHIVSIVANCYLIYPILTSYKNGK